MRDLKLKKYWVFLVFMILFSCEDEFPEFNPTVEHVYDGYFLVWSKKDVIRNPSTGAITTNTTRDFDRQYIFRKDAILRSTNGGKNFDTLTDFHISLDSISYTYPDGGLRESFFVRDIFRMKNGDPRIEDKVNPRDDKFPELKEFYLFLELENKKKSQGENSEITEILLLYSEGFDE